VSQLSSLLLLTLVVGSVYAMAATGLVLTYRTSRVFNFAHGAVGMFSAYVFRQFWVVWHIPLPVAVFLVVGVVAPAAGVVMERLLFRPLRSAATVVKVVATVGLLVALQGLVTLIWGKAGMFIPPLVAVRSFRVTSNLAIGSDQLLILAVAVGTILGLGLLLSRTRFGLEIRSVVDRPDLAELSGVRSGRVSAVAWGIGFATAALAGVLLSPMIGLDSYTLTLLVIQGYAAAIIGRLVSLPMTFVGGLLVALLEQSATLYLPPACGPCRAIRPSIPFLLIFVVLALAAAMPKGRLGAWVAIATRDETAAPPPRPRQRERRRVAPVALVAFGLVALMGPLVSARWLLSLEGALALTGVFASISVLTGLSGQISLGHTAFVGTGAFVMGALAGHPGFPFPLALVLAGLAAVPVGLLVALPAIRLQGLFLALLTFGFGLVATSLFGSSLGHATSGVTVARPSFASSDLSYFYVLLVIAALLLLVASNLERSPSGRILASIRDSEKAARSIGLNLARYKLAAFTLSAFMAGIAGAALGAFQTVVTYNDFNIFYSLIWLSVAVIGGVGSVWGAAIAGLVWLAGSVGAGSSGQIFFGLGALLLARNQQGALGALRDALGFFSRLSELPRVAVRGFSAREAPEISGEVTGGPP